MFIDFLRSYHSETNMATNSSHSDAFLMNLMGSDMASSTATLWDPLLSKDWDQEKVTDQCVLRIKRYSLEIYVKVKLFRKHG